MYACAHAGFWRLRVKPAEGARGADREDEPWSEPSQDKDSANHVTS